MIFLFYTIIIKAPDTKGVTPMLHLLKKIKKKVAAPPGTLVHVGERKLEHATITQIIYSQASYTETELTDIKDLILADKPGNVTWININGLHDTAIIKQVGDLFNIDPLAQEDILNTLQRPKVEDFKDYLIQIMKMLVYDPEKKEIKSEQLSLILGKNYVITFQEQEGDVFQPVRDRIKSARGKIRKKGGDYLLYALTDAVVDNYFLIMENLGEDIETMEDELLQNSSPHTLHEIQKLRKELIYLRKGIWPLREILNTLVRGDSPLIHHASQPYFRDVYDHTIQVIETTETFRDLVAGLQDLYLSTISNRMNQVMKVLTIIATIFIPLTFIAGIYGMNFEFMPELKFKAGYFIVWGLMIVLGMGMVFYFKRRKWL